jgi:hypothetical protein
MSHNSIAFRGFWHYAGGVKFLTRQEQLFLGIVIGLLLTGLGVKWYRTAHPAAVQKELPAAAGVQ